MICWCCGEVDAFLDELHDSGSKADVRRLLPWPKKWCRAEEHDTDMSLACYYELINQWWKYTKVRIIFLQCLFSWRVFAAGKQSHFLQHIDERCAARSQELKQDTRSLEQQQIWHLEFRQLQLMMLPLDFLASVTQGMHIAKMIKMIYPSNMCWPFI